MEQIKYDTYFLLAVFLFFFLAMMFSFLKD